MLSVQRCAVALGPSTILLLMSLTQPAAAQFVPPPPPVEQPNVANPNQRLKVQRPSAPGANDVVVIADSEESDGPLRHLRGHVHLETIDKTLDADEADYDEDTGDAEVRGHVRYENFLDGTKIQCDHGEYNVNSETGVFFDITGTSQPKIVSRPGYLTTTNPFYFQGEWAEKQEDRYIIHKGFITDCKVPKPWWKLTAPKFDIIPGNRAIGYHAIFRIKQFPIFYAPAYRKSLEKLPRQSGFLTPNIGRSSLYGGMFGLSYYWAISRSYDALYRIQYFTARGTAHTLDFRGKITPGTDYSLNFYGVNDRLNQGGYQVRFDGRSALADGWEARWSVDYLSSFLFREAFAPSFEGAIAAESHSVGFLARHWSSFGLDIVADRDEQFEDIGPKDKIIIKKLPEVDFLSRDRQILDGPLPVWFSMTSSAGFLDRSQPEFETSRFVPRLDVYPELTSAFHWWGFSMTVSVAARETEYGSSMDYQTNIVSTEETLRSAREIRIDMIPPAFEKIYNAPRWLGGGKLKHVIEPRIKYDFVDGIDDFNRIIRFDETDVMSDTDQVTLSITNRFFVKDKNGNVNEVLSWEVEQSRYFDPTFGGAAVPGQRDVVAGTLDLDGFAFLDGPRNYSPVVSALRFQHRVNVEWLLDYDPLLKHVSSSTFSTDMRFSNFFFSAGHTEVRPNPVVAPSSDQLRGTFGIGNQTRKGWNAAFSTYYDYKRGVTDFSLFEVTYNTDCCGISVEYRRINAGIRDDTQYRVAFAVANLGSFGTLRKQERIY